MVVDGTNNPLSLEWGGAERRPHGLRSFLRGSGGRRRRSVLCPSVCPSHLADQQFPDFLRIDPWIFRGGGVYGSVPGKRGHIRVPPSHERRKIPPTEKWTSLGARLPGCERFGTCGHFMARNGTITGASRNMQDFQAFLRISKGWWWTERTIRYRVEEADARGHEGP